MIRREILKEVLLDNRNEVVKHQVIPRSFQFEEFGNYVFVGIRRAGKSFLLYQRIQELLHDGHTWNEMLYVNFEDERLIGMTAADLNLILEVHAEMSTDRPMLFLDEIQNIDGWDKFVRRLQYMYTLMILKSFFMLMGLKLQRILCLQQRAGQK